MAVVVLVVSSAILEFVFCRRVALVNNRRWLSLAADEPIGVLRAASEFGWLAALFSWVREH